MLNQKSLINYNEIQQNKIYEVSNISDALSAKEQKKMRNEINIKINLPRMHEKQFEF